MKLPMLHQATAYRNGNHIAVQYRGFQGTDYLNRAESERYLEALDGGYVGRHSGL